MLNLVLCSYRSSLKWFLSTFLHGIFSLRIVLGKEEDESNKAKRN